MHILHVTSSRFYGGPERQILELAREFAQNGNHVRNTVVSFSENGLCREFLDQIEQAQLEGLNHVELQHDTPHLISACRELEKMIVDHRVDLICVNGYKASILGQFAAKRQNVKVVAISRGWTAENRRVQLYECLDRWALRRMDHVVCVSHEQAKKVMERARVPKNRISVIHNAIRPERFPTQSDRTYRQKLEASASGTPAVATDVGGTREVLLNIRTGRVVPPSDHQVLSWAIEALLNNQQQRAKLAKEGKRYVQEKFNFARQATAYGNLFTLLTNKT